MGFPFDTATLDWTMIGVLVAIATLIVAVLAWRRPRGVNPAEAVLVIRPFGDADYPNIHATNGVPSLDQLTQGFQLDAKGIRAARHLYEAGLGQFNHYVNNLDGVIADAQAAMDELRPQLSQLELALADSVGLALATAQGEELRVERTRYDALRLPIQTYAEHKRQQHQAQQCIANALRHNVPRTDYTLVKSRIASGEFSLATIMSELPIYWQDLRTLDREDRTPEPRDRPPKREYYNATFMTQDMGILEDNRAVRDGDWLISERHGILVPYQEPVPVLRFERPDRPPVPTGKYEIIIDRKPGFEWDTELWRQGGYLDQTYQRSKAGRLPEQLRRAYRRRLIGRIGWATSAITLAVYIVLVALRFL